MLSLLVTAETILKLFNFLARGTLKAPQMPPPPPHPPLV